MRAEQVDGATLLELDHEQLVELGITSKLKRQFPSHPILCMCADVHYERPVLCYPSSRMVAALVIVFLAFFGVHEGGDRY